MSEPVACLWCGSPMDPRIMARLGLSHPSAVVEDWGGHVAVLLCLDRECGAVSPFGLGVTKAQAILAAEDKARRPRREVADG